MSLIICPECGQQVSDKAEICPHCGIKIAGYVNIPPTPQQDANMHTAENNAAAPQPAPKKGKKSAKLIAVSFILALAICGITYYFYNNAQTKKEQEDYSFAMTSTDPTVMQMYLSRYADAPQEHRDSVEARLNTLAQEDTDWRNAVVSGTKAALEEYLQAHPASPHRGEARNKIDSIDYAIASRANNMEAYKQYLAQHPDGKYAGLAQDFIDEKKQSEVQPEESALAKTVCRHFFQAINARNESKLLETVADYLSDFLNRKGATGSDVVTFMNKLYKEDITNLNWHLLDDFKITKTKNEEGAYDMTVQFSAVLNMERTDPTKEKTGHYNISCTITPEGKITSMSMKKLDNAIQ